MSNDRIYKILIADAQWDELNPQPPQSVQIADNGTDQAYLVGEAGFADWDALTSTLVGSWDLSQPYGDGYVQEGQTVDEFGVVTGTPTHPITADLFDWIRVLGNNPDGTASGPLDSTKWQGHPSEKFAVEVNPYPLDQRPFTIQIDRQDQGAGAEAYDAGTVYAEGDYAYSTPGTVWRSLQDNNVGNPQFGGSAWWEFVNPSGWGWICTVLSDDPSRTITARAIAIYSDPECTAYLGTSGSFYDDGSGNYICTCPTALYTATKEDVYWSLLFGSTQEGHYTLPASDDTISAQFWEDNQP